MAGFAETGTRRRLTTEPPRFAALLRSIRWKHALGEVLLIVVGVLTALAVNSWNDQRRQRQLERKTPAQLRVELTGDLASVRAIHDEVRERERRMISLLAGLEDGTIARDSADTRFGAVLRIWEL